MASFRIEDQENATLSHREDNADIFSAAQRRPLVDLKLPSLPNESCKVQDENSTVRQIKKENNIVTLESQFHELSLHEDKPSEVEVKKSDCTFEPFISKEISKPFVAKDLISENLFVNAAENVGASCANAVEKQPDVPKEAPTRQPLDNAKDAVESPMSIVDKSKLSMSISKNESTLLKEIIEDEKDKATAQTDREMFSCDAEYRQDIYEYLRKIECNNRPKPHYMRKQLEISHVMRSNLIDWLAAACVWCNLRSETLHLAVSYVDRFLSRMRVVRTKLQLIGTAATFIAAKYEEVYPPKVLQFVSVTNDAYTKPQVLRAESLILKVLMFDLSTPTSLAFLSHYCICNRLSKKTFHLASYIAELCLLEADPYLQYKPSIIAAASLATARHCLLCETCKHYVNNNIAEDDMSGGVARSECVSVSWPASLEATSGYAAADLQPALKDLARTHAHAMLHPFQAIPNKYKTNKYEAVSSIEPRPMFPVAKYVAPTAAAPASAHTAAAPAAAPTATAASTVAAPAAAPTAAAPAAAPTAAAPAAAPTAAAPAADPTAAAPAAAPIRPANSKQRFTDSCVVS